MQETNVSLRHCSTNQQSIFLLILHLKAIWGSIGKETLKEIKHDVNYNPHCKTADKYSENSQTDKTPFQIKFFLQRTKLLFFKLFMIISSFFKR